MSNRVFVACFLAFLLCFFVWFANNCHGAEDVTWDCDYWLEHLADISEGEQRINDIRSRLSANPLEGLEYYALFMQLKQEQVRIWSLRTAVKLDIDADDARLRLEELN